jgi:hypothetical protein
MRSQVTKFVLYGREGIAPCDLGIELWFRSKDGFEYRMCQGFLQDDMRTCCQGGLSAYMEVKSQMRYQTRGARESTLGRR